VKLRTQRSLPPISPPQTDALVTHRNMIEMIGYRFFVFMIFESLEFS